MDYWKKTSISRINRIFQQIAFPKVRKCFETIDEGIVYEGMQFQEHVKSTILHLQVI
jgi:hypothetical protein